MKNKKCQCGCKNDATVKLIHNWGKCRHVFMCDTHKPEWADGKALISPPQKMFGLEKSWYQVNYLVENNVA